MTIDEQLLMNDIDRLTARLREAEDKCALVSEWELAARTLVEELRSKLTFQRVEMALAAGARDAAEKVLQEAATLLGVPQDKRYHIGAKYGPIAELQEQLKEARARREEAIKEFTKELIETQDELQRVMAERDDVVSKLPTDSPSGEGDSLLFNAYGRQCYHAGRKSALKEVHEIATEDNDLSALGALIQITKIADRETVTSDIKPEGWQPIETAPKVHPLDGGEDLLLGWNAPGINEWIQVVGCWRGGWFTGDRNAYPTHWQRLPPPPGD